MNTGDITRFSISVALCTTLVMATPAVAERTENQSFSAAVNITIEAQRLDRALNLLAQQSGFQIVTFSGDALDKTTRTLSGSYTGAQALDLLLRGTGLTWRRVDDATIAIGTPARFAEENSQSDAAVKSELNTRALVKEKNSGEQRREVDEIVVTATRRATSLQDTALSITALGSETIERKGLVSREDYLRSLPGVSLIDNGPGQNNLVIRGAYGEAFSTGPTVGIYMADVPLTGFAIGGSADIKLVDIERVEILRGPQGTLYGSNSLSGTVRYIPAPPDLENFEGKIEAGYSQTEEFGGNNTALQGMINIPLVPNELAVRAVAYRYDNDGYVKNIAGDDPTLQAAATTFGAENLAINKDHVGSNSFTGGRIGVLWQPSDAFNMSLTYINQDTAQADRPFEQSSRAPYQRSSYQLGNIIGNDDALRVDLDIINLVMEYDFAWATLLSSTSRVEQMYTRKWEIGSFFGEPAIPIPQTSITDAGIFVQELRLTSSLEGPWQFVTGLYYEDSDQPTTQTTFFGGEPALNPFAAVKLWDLILDRQVTQKAVFGEVSYQITEQFKATAGSRFFKYDTRFIQSIFDSVVIPEGGNDDRTKESGNTFKVGLEYRPDDDVLLYTNWSEGFRLGRPLNSDSISAVCDTDQDGFLDGTDIPSSLDRVDSDTLESYEVGGKFTFLDGTATLNAAVYRNNWTGIPVSIRPPGCLANTIINGGEARAQGVELEGAVTLSDQLRLMFGLGYVDTELTATTSAGNDGDRMNYTPELNGNLGMEYDFVLAGYDAFVRSDFTWFGDYFTGTGETGQKLDSYSLVNVGAGMRVGQLDVRLHISNLLNDDSFTSLEGVVPPDFAIRLRPRTVGLTLGYNF